MRLPRSIHGRMLLVAAVTTLVALVVTGFAMGGVLERFATRHADQRLEDRLRMLGAVVRRDGSIDRALLGRESVATAIAAGAAWRIDAPGGTTGGAMLHGLNDRDALPLPAPEPRRRHGPPPPPGDAMPFEARLADGTRVHGRTALIGTDAGVVRIAVAVPREQIDRPLAAAMVPLLTMLAAVAAVLAAATLVQLRLGLRPLRALRDHVGAVRRGEADTVPVDQPDELRPLATELNALLADNQAALAGARASAANLAHALKTPVATLSLTLAGDAAAAAQLARIEGVIRHHLARARVAAIGHQARAALAPVLADLVPAVTALHRHATIEVAVEDAPCVGVDGHDLTEMVGNLLDNAARHARSRVRVTAARNGRTVALTIADDGPGIPAAARASALRPGMRLDERGGGDGFGLAIVAELVALYGGALALDEAAGGGLSVRLSLPAAAPPRAA